MGSGDDGLGNINDDPFDDPQERARMRRAAERADLTWVFSGPIHQVRVNWKAWLAIAGGIYMIAGTDIQAIIDAIPGLGK